MLCILALQPKANAQTTIVRYPRMRFASELTARNAFYVEYFPARSGVSINYDYRSSENFTVRIGYGEFSYRGEAPHYLPVSFDYLFNSGPHNIQIGAGMIALESGGADWLLGPRRRRINDTIVAVTPSGGSDGIFTADIGYRYEPKQGGFIGVVALTIMGAVNVAPVTMFTMRLGYVF
ncbi:MAG TPA: hypothetical protein VFA55_04120 [Candidatus Kapabacteria bacterium]|nr:hypothetical protein [Candidatus Kapabacteria bacterium]